MKSVIRYMPKVNLSGPVAKDLQHKLAEARHLRAAGDYHAAAEKYRHCARLQAQLAEFAINGQVKLQQLQVAKTYAETAQRLDGQRDLSPQRPETIETHHHQIRSLIVKSNHYLG